MADNERDDSLRPDPDALLALAEKDRRGKLTVFLGAAPGVGKTYAMLTRAGRLKAEGVDVVVGLVETHGRGETAALVDGLEVLPRTRVGHRGKVLEEFDLDGALARHPKIVLVDELAHSNPEGSRHPKRYQDIEELTAAGIDVWTALNIQHLESLADLVAQITGVTVRERVPDVVLKKADEDWVAQNGSDNPYQRTAHRLDSTAIGEGEKPSAQTKLIAKTVGADVSASYQLGETDLGSGADLLTVVVYDMISPQ